MIVLMRSQSVTLLTRGDPTPQPGTVGTSVAGSGHLHHEDMLEMSMQALLIILIAMLVLLMMVAWEHYPNSDLSKWSSLLSPCMNISHRTAICLWLYLIAAEMMMLTMVMVLNAWRRTLLLPILESDGFLVMNVLILS